MRLDGSERPEYLRPPRRRARRPRAGGRGAAARNRGRAVGWSRSPTPGRNRKSRRAGSRGGEALRREAAGIPVVISAFDGAALEEVRASRRRPAATVARWTRDCSRCQRCASVGRARIRPGGARHRALRRGSACRAAAGTSASMAVMGATTPSRRRRSALLRRAERPRRLSTPASWSAAPRRTPHQDLNEFGCGPAMPRADAAGVWNNAERSRHARGVSPPRSALERFERGFAASPPGSAAPATCASAAGRDLELEPTAKPRRQELNGQDFIGWPDVVWQRPAAGGERQRRRGGTNQVGTDARSRPRSRRCGTRRQTSGRLFGNSGTRRRHDLGRRRRQERADGRQRARQRAIGRSATSSRRAAAGRAGDEPRGRSRTSWRPARQSDRRTPGRPTATNGDQGCSIGDAARLGRRRDGDGAPPKSSGRGRR